MTTSTMQGQPLNGQSAPPKPTVTPEQVFRDLVAKQLGHLTLTALELQAELTALRAAQQAAPSPVPDDQPRPSA